MYWWGVNGGRDRCLVNGDWINGCWRWQIIISNFITIIISLSVYLLKPFFCVWRKRVLTASNASQRSTALGLKQRSSQHLQPDKKSYTKLSDCVRCIRADWAAGVDQSVCIVAVRTSEIYVFLVCNRYATNRVIVWLTKNQRRSNAWNHGVASEKIRDDRFE